MRVYLDHAATTPLDPRVLEEMEPYFSKNFGNPGSIHAEGVVAKDAVSRARQKIGSLLGASPQDIIFTSGGTEANNLAIMGVFTERQKNGVAPEDMHFITTSLEHSSVLDVFDDFEARGARITYLGVNPDGVVSAEEVRKALSKNTVLVSVMYANNEIGTIEPITAISGTIRHFKRRKGKLLNVFPFFHTDASQAPLYCDMSVERLGVDLLALDGQKIYGPKGVGVLYKRKGVAVSPLFYGGGQEFGLRPGTENVSGIVGFAEAFRIGAAERKEESRRLRALRDYFIKKVLQSIPTAELNGHAVMRLPNNANISFPGLDGEWLTVQLDAQGVAVGTKSACLSEESGGSYVIRALGRGEDQAASSVRFTLGRKTTKKDLDYTVAALQKIVSNP